MPRAEIHVQEEDRGERLIFSKIRKLFPSLASKMKWRTQRKVFSGTFPKKRYKLFKISNNWRGVVISSVRPRDFQRIAQILEFFPEKRFPGTCGRGSKKNESSGIIHKGILPRVKSQESLPDPVRVLSPRTTRIIEFPPETIHEGGRGGR